MYCTHGQLKRAILGLGQVIEEEHFREMWQLLRRIVMVLMRPGIQLSSAEGRSELQAALMRYGELAQKHLGVKACKYNLHLLACRYPLCPQAPNECTCERMHTCACGQADSVCTPDFGPSAEYCNNACLKRSWPASQSTGVRLHAFSCIFCLRSVSEHHSTQPDF